MPISGFIGYENRRKLRHCLSPRGQTSLSPNLGRRLHGMEASSRVAAAIPVGVACRTRPGSSAIGHPVTRSLRLTAGCGVDARIATRAHAGRRRSESRSRWQGRGIRLPARCGRSREVDEAGARGQQDSEAHILVRRSRPRLAFAEVATDRAVRPALGPVAAAAYPDHAAGSATIDSSTASTIEIKRSRPGVSPVARSWCSDISLPTSLAESPSGTNRLRFLTQQRLERRGKRGRPQPACTPSAPSVVASWVTRRPLIARHALLSSICM